MRFLALVIATVAVAGACTSSDRQSDLWAQPEAALMPPGTTILDKRESAPQPAILEAAPWVGYLLGSNDHAEAISAYHGEELSRLGWWVPVDTDHGAGARAAPTTSELFANSWRKGDYVFRLGILDESSPAAEGRSTGYESVFRTSLYYMPVKPAKS